MQNQIPYQFMKNFTTLNAVAASSSIARTPIAGGEADCMRSIFIKHKERFRRVDFETILFVKAEGSYCSVYLADGHTLTLCYSLCEITRSLSPALFFRAHRSYTVNINQIDAFVGNVLYVGVHKIPISKQHRPDVLGRFNVLGCSK